jgi:hypothetical protein
MQRLLNPTGRVSSITSLMPQVFTRSIIIMSGATNCASVGTGVAIDIPFITIVRVLPHGLAVGLRNTGQGPIIMNRAACVFLDAGSMHHGRIVGNDSLRRKEGFKILACTAILGRTMMLVIIMAMEI